MGPAVGGENVVHSRSAQRAQDQFLCGTCFILSVSSFRCHCCSSYKEESDKEITALKITVLKIFFTKYAWKIYNCNGKCNQKISNFIMESVMFFGRIVCVFICLCPCFGQFLDGAHCCGERRPT